MHLKTQNKSKERYINMKCEKCNGNLIKSYEDENPKCLQCGFQKTVVPKEVLKEVKKYQGQVKIGYKPHEPRYYYDLEYAEHMKRK